MSMAEDNGTEKPYPYDLIYSNSNDLISCTYNRKRSVQYTNEHESSSHTPKRNRMEASDCDIEFEQHPSKLGQNKQGTAKMSTATTTISSYFNKFNMGHQLKKASMTHLLDHVVSHHDKHFHHFVLHHKMLTNFQQQN